MRNFFETFILSEIKEVLKNLELEKYELITWDNFIIFYLQIYYQLITAFSENKFLRETIKQNKMAGKLDLKKYVDDNKSQLEKINDLNKLIKSF